MVQYGWGANKKKAHFSPYFSKYMYVAPALKNVQDAGRRGT